MAHRRTARNLLATMATICFTWVAGCAPTPYFEAGELSPPPRIRIGPQLGNVMEAVAYIEYQTCDIFEFVVHHPDIQVNYSTRRCGLNGAMSVGAIFITDPARCPRTYDAIGLGLAVHELVHSLGHWQHDKHVDASPHSVMEAWVYPDWELFDDDIEFIKERWCQ